MPLTVCRLSSSAVVLAERISQRGRDHGPGLTKLIDRAAVLQARFARDDIADFVVETTDRSVDDVTLAVIRQWCGAATSHPAR